MSRKHIASAISAALLAGGLVAAVASPASALVTETDDITLRGSGFDFGGPGFANGEPTTPGDVEWDQAWFGVIPSVKGDIHFDGVSTDCARIRLISYDVNGVEWQRDNGDTECAPDNGHHSFPVDVTGRAGSPEVLVTLQSLTPNGWAFVAQQRHFYGPTVDTDDVQINRATYDFGTGNLVQGSPADAGTLTWNVEGLGVLRPDLDGLIYLNDTTECARTRMRYYEADGDVITTKYGGTVCGTNDELKKWTVNLHPFASAAITSVKVTIERFDGSPPPGVWVAVGSQTVALS